MCVSECSIDPMTELHVDVHVNIIECIEYNLFENSF